MSIPSLLRTPGATRVHSHPLDRHPDCIHLDPRSGHFASSSKSFAKRNTVDDSDPDDAPILAKSKQPPPKKRRIVADDDDDEDEESYKPVIKVESKTKAKGKAAVCRSDTCRFSSRSQLNIVGCSCRS